MNDEITSQSNEYGFLLEALDFTKFLSYLNVLSAIVLCFNILIKTFLIL